MSRTVRDCLLDNSRTERVYASVTIANPHTQRSLFNHMMVMDLWFFNIVPLFNLSLTATKMVDVKKECNVEFYHIISQYSSNVV